MLLLSLVVGIQHPRSFVQNKILQILVLFQLRGERGLVRLLLPELEHVLNLWVLIDDISSQSIGIERGGQ